MGEIPHEFTCCSLIKNSNTYLSGKFILKFIYKHSLWMEPCPRFLTTQHCCSGNPRLFQAPSFYHYDYAFIRAELSADSLQTYIKVCWSPESRELLMYEPNWCLEYEAQINWTKKVTALEFWPTLMFLVPMSLLLFLIFGRQFMCVPPPRGSTNQA